MKMRKTMWFSLFIQIATLIVVLSLLLMQKAIPDLLWGMFVTSMFICIVLSILVQRANVKDMSIKRDRRLGFKGVLLYISLMVPLVVLLFVSHVINS